VVAERTVYDGWLESFFYSPPLTPPGIEVLDGRELGPSDVLKAVIQPVKVL
jgi:hypothetical protein